MATWLAIAGFLAILGLPLYLMWGGPGIFRGYHVDEGPTVGGGPVGYDNAPTDTGGGDAGGGGDS